MIHRSLRGRIAIAAALSTAVVLVLGGLVVNILVTHTERQALDGRLAEQSAAAQLPVLDALSRGLPVDSSTLSTRRPDVGTIIRVYRNDVEVGSVGLKDVRFPSPQIGYDTVNAGGRSWRVHVTEIVSQGSGTDSILLETAVPTTVTDELVDNLRWRTIEVAALSSVLAGLAGWFFGGLATKPLARLRSAAEQVSNGRDLSVRVPSSGTQEIDDLANSLNVMLARLQEAAASTAAALASSRAFAGNAAHEMRTPLTSMQANLDVLQDNPDLVDAERNEILASLLREQTRLVRLLDALHTLARGDVVGEAQRELLDFSDLVAVSVDGAKRRHPSIEFHYDVPAEESEIVGWTDGLKVMVDNLLNNAARHGGSNVWITVESDSDSVSLLVDDDGAGVPVEERERIFEHFFRGSATRVEGSGLGLALVAQQARLHDGNVEVTDSPSGGARFTVRLSTQSPTRSQAT